MTAFITWSGPPISGDFIWDSAMVADQPIPPGREVPANGRQLVVALFADGSVAGDSAWAAFFPIERQDKLEVLTNAIADLEARGDRSGKQLIDYIGAVGASRAAPAADKAQAANLAAARLAQFGDRALFAEKTPDLKAANIAAEAANQRLAAIEFTYRTMKSLFEYPGAGPWADLAEPEKIRRELAELRYSLNKLTAGLPFLPAQPR